MAIDRPRARPNGRARMLRFLLLAVVVIGLAPGTFVRAPVRTRGEAAVVTVTPLAARTGVAGELELTGAWELTAEHGWFGGFSALAANGEGGLLAGSDRGFLLDLDISGEAPRALPGSFRFVGISDQGREEVIDLESLARDPATGTLWAGFEYDNLIIRFARDGTRRITAPPDMAQWSMNSGPETMERLADGRFLVIEEGTGSVDANAHQALLYADDPVAGAKPLAFHFVSPDSYDPVDAAQLPDGRVLILLRRVEYALPARFDTAIAIADPRTIRAGRDWRAQVIQRLEAGVFADNFEGMAYVPSAADPARGAVWVIADDNFSLFQRSILVRFMWDGQTASPAPDTPQTKKRPETPDA